MDIFIGDTFTDGTFIGGMFASSMFAGDMFTGGHIAVASMEDIGTFLHDDDDIDGLYAAVGKL